MLLSKICDDAIAVLLAAYTIELQKSTYKSISKESESYHFVVVWIDLVNVMSECYVFLADLL